MTAKPSNPSKKKVRARKPPHEPAVAKRTALPRAPKAPHARPSRSTSTGAARPRRAAKAAAREPESWDAASTVVVVNSAAGGGKVGREWRTLALDLTKALGDVRFVLSRGPGHAIELAAEAVRDGARTILSLGGDGTHNEVVNGIVKAQAAPGAVRLGILPAGTGGDFRRLLAHGETLHESAYAMPTASVAPIDVGVIRFMTDEGRRAERHFLNIASLGVSGLVCRAVNASSKRLGGKATFLLATLKTLPRFKPPRVRLYVDEDDVGDFIISSISVCNGRYAGGSMLFAPDARLGDGLFDITVIQHASILRSLPDAPKLYDGSILDSPFAESFRGKYVKVAPLDDRKAYIDIDGEAPGVAPAELAVVPHALRLIGARADVL